MQVLDFSYCSDTTDADIDYLRSLVNLTKKVLYACDKVTDTGLKQLKSLTNLTSLNVYACDEQTLDWNTCNREPI